MVIHCITLVGSTLCCASPIQMGQPVVQLRTDIVLRSPMLVVGRLLPVKRTLCPAAPGAAEPRLEPRLHRGPHPGRAPVQAARRPRRVHPRVPGHPRGAQARGRQRHRRPVRPVRPAQRAGPHLLGQRPRVRGQDGPGLDRRRGREDRLHYPALAGASVRTRSTLRHVAAATPLRLVLSATDLSRSPCIRYFLVILITHGKVPTKAARHRRLHDADRAGAG
jgi:hypothetical protein